MAPAALQIREVISASMEPSAETIEPRYVNEGTNSTNSPLMFIGMVIAEYGKIIMCDRNIPTKLKDKVYKTAIKPAMVYGQARSKQCRIGPATVLWDHAHYLCKHKS